MRLKQGILLLNDILKTDTCLFVSEPASENTSTEHPFVGTAFWADSYRTMFPDLEYWVVDDPFHTPALAKSGSDYIDALVDRMIPALKLSLNALHGQSKSTRYWRLLIEPWLYHYLCNAYHAFQLIESVNMRFPGFLLYGFKRSKHFTPSSTQNSIEKMKAPPYSTQIITRVVEHLNLVDKVIYENKNTIKSKKDMRPVSIRGKVARLSREKLIRLYDRLICPRTCVAHFKSGFSFKDQVMLLLKSGCKISRFFFDEGAIEIKKECNDEKRQEWIPLEFKDNSPFDRFIREQAIDDIPTVFIEGYQALSEEADLNVKKYAQLEKIFTSVGQYYNEGFKFTMALLAENGCKILMTPHGANSGVHKHTRLDSYETKVADKWYSWGWCGGASVSNNITPMPSSLLMRYRNKWNVKKKKEYALFGLTTVSASCVSLPVEASYFREYLRWQNIFLLGLNVKAFNQIMVRPHREDNGWRLKDTLQKKFGNKLRFQSWDTCFVDAIKKARLYVSDHCSTTYAIALAMNVPTVVFWDTNYFEHTDHADIEIQALKEVGIFHDSPDSAAKHVNDIIDDVNGWWGSRDVQAAKDSFCQNYAKVSPAAIRMWRKELLT